MKILLLGYGKMGRLIEQLCTERGHTIEAVIDQPSEWDTLNSTEIDLAIDFSTPSAVMNNIFNCLDRNIPIVVGTTGWFEKMDAVKKLFVEKDGALFYASNFSLGMNVVFRLNRTMARMLNKADYRFSMTEIHHIHKLDAPSGTAIQLATDIIHETDTLKNWSIEDKSDYATLPIHVIRENEVPGTHEIVADSSVDTIVLRHEAKGRQGFASGALVAAEFLLGKKGIYTMDDLLDLIV